jgi:hypothetical protein
MLTHPKRHFRGLAETAYSGMIVLQRVIQLRLPEWLANESDRLTVLQRLACRRVDVRTDNDRTYSEAFVDLARGLRAAASMREMQVHENDVRSMGFRTGDSFGLGCRHRADLMPELFHKQLKAHREDDLILDDQKFHVQSPLSQNTENDGPT